MAKHFISGLIKILLFQPLNVQVFQTRTDTNLRGVNESLAILTIDSNSWLNTHLDYVDLFLIQVHDPLSGTDSRLATYKALLEIKAAGKIRSVVVSN